MLKNFIYNMVRLLAVAAAVMLVDSCTDLHGDDFNPSVGTGNGGGDRTPSEVSRRTLLLYSAGFNSLSSYLKEDIEDITKGYLPGGTRSDNVLLVYSHLPESANVYDKPTSPVLMRIYKDESADVVMDTLVVYPAGTLSSSHEQLNEVLTYMKDEFPSDGYGMIFSSHASGYLPAGYYSNSDDFETGIPISAGLFANPLNSLAVPYAEPEYDPSMPLTKSIGQDIGYSGGKKVSYEMDLIGFADAIPVYMDYILFDACLMGGVETAYQLRDVCGLVGFSQAEVLAEGFDYTALVSHLLEHDIPMPQKVCEDYFLQYDVQTGVYRSATISMVDCSKMDRLVQVCSELFEEYREPMSRLTAKNVQRFYRSNYHWFFDLESILAESGMTLDQLNSLRDAFSDCVVYKAATPSFMNSFSIRTFCGLSMFLPSEGGQYLKNHYKKLDWNIDTGLVK